MNPYEECYSEAVSRVRRGLDAIPSATDTKAAARNIWDLVEEIKEVFKRHPEDRDELEAIDLLVSLDDLQAEAREWL